MTPQPPLDVKSIFGRALELDDPGRRAAYLAEACADAPAVRAEVEELLGMHDRAGGFLRRPAGVTADLTAPYQPLSERPGTRVGPYKLLQQIGEGGMGTVFMAEQEEPVRRTVAVKIIKPGMDSRQVVARFEAERQALAMMDHTNIARVLDAGTTDTGRPYFVMELVHGVPIIEYCDANKLTPRQRLELFVPVCQAIQHAHMKGIIHRDVKPSNVLVTMYDDKPVPKVIDFGVAKAVEQKLTEKTLFTQYGALVGTFEYMSPEQAEMNAFGVDTRSDVYSLGVLLYELLTGTTPLERARLRQAAYGEIVRLIKEEEPPRPSVRLSTSGTLAKVAEARKTEPAKLSSLVRGELDWIVMKALEKDRTRRYETATGLAKDVQRYLAGDAVEACPPTLGYRLRKAYRRNRAAVLTFVSFAAVLLVATTVSLAFGIQAKRSERFAAVERDRAVSAEQALQVRHDEALRSEQKAREQADAAGFLLDNLLGQDDEEETTIGNVSFKILLDRAVKELDRDLSRDAVAVARIRSRMGRAYISLGRYDDAHAQLESARVGFQRALGDDHLETIATQEQLALAKMENRAEGELLMRDVLARRRAIQGATHPDVIRTLRYLGGICARQGGFGKNEKLREAEAFYRDALHQALLAHGHESKVAINCKLELVGHIARKGMHEESQRLTREAVASARRILSKGDPNLLRVKFFALRYEKERLGSPAEFRAMVEGYKELYDEFKQYYGAEHPNTMAIQDDIVFASIHANWAFGKLFEEADAISAELLERTKQAFGRNSTDVTRKLALRAYVLLARGQPTAARVLFEDALKGAKSHQSKGYSLLGLGECLLKEKQYEAAKARLTEGYQEIRSVFEGEGLSTYRRLRVETALQSLIAVASNLNKPDEVRKWQKELDELPPK